MKTTVVVLLMFVLNHTYSQSYKAAFRSEICDCIEQESLKLRFSENTYNKCFKATLPNYAAQIDAQIVEEDLNKKYLKGQLIRKDLTLALKYELIYSCDVYYEHAEAIMRSKKLIARENAKESDLESQNQQVALTPNAITYFRRAKLQYKLGNLKEAEADLNKSLEVNPNKDKPRFIRLELVFLAWVYEEQERFSEAIALYDKVYQGDYDTEIAILRALAHKKSGGTLANVSNSYKESTKKDIAILKKEQRGLDNNKPATRRIASETRSKVKNKKKKDTASLRKLFKIDN